MTKGISIRFRSESIAKHRVRDSLLHKYNALLFKGSENKANESHRLETVTSGKRCQLKKHLCHSSLPRNVLASRQSSLFIIIHANDRVLSHNKFSATQAKNKQNNLIKQHAFKVSVPNNDVTEKYFTDSVDILQDC